METIITFKTINFLGIDYLGRKVNLVKGKIQLKDNKKLNKHIAFFANNKFNFMPLYEDIRYIKNKELASIVDKDELINLVEDHYTCVMSKGAIDIIMVSDDEFVSKTSVSDIPMNQEIKISI